MTTVTGYNPDRNTGPFALAAKPGALCRGARRLGGGSAAHDRTIEIRLCRAMTCFAPALGAIRSGQPAAGTADADRLAELRDTLRAANYPVLAEQVDIQWQVVSAWLLYADGKREAALNAMRAAADAEDKTEKATVTPGPLAPARELYAAMLLEQGMAREALAAYEDSIAKEPNRFHGLAGAAKAAERLGDREKARAYYGWLVSLTSGPTGDRRELIAAKEFLARP